MRLLTLWGSPLEESSSKGTIAHVTCFVSCRCLLFTASAASICVLATMSPKGPIRANGDGFGSS